MADRLWWIDALRGAGVVMMIAYHMLWDLSFLGLWSGDASAGWPRVLAIATGTVFLGTVGLSLASYRSNGGKPPWARSARLLLIAIAITLITALLFPAQAILFGVLHCIALSVLLVFPLATRPLLATAAGALMVAAGALLAAGGLSFPVLGPLPPGMSSLDHYPILPWAGVAALGAAAGAVLLRSSAVRSPQPRWARPLSAAGRRSLIIYLVHQPLLLMLLYPISVMAD